MFPKIVLTILICFIGVANAAPMIISDNRLDFLEASPSIGRGYSPHTNQFSGFCFQDVGTPTPSIDFKYRWKELSRQDLGTIRGDEFYEKIPVQEFVKTFFKEFKVVRSGREEKKIPLVNLLFGLKIESQVYSAEDSGLKLAISSVRQLKDQQYDAFLRTCGSHFVRSYGNQGSFFVLLQYQTNGPESDQSFKTKLQQYIRSFGSGLEIDKDFLKESENRGMEIFAESVGLRTEFNIDLLPKDIPELRETLSEISRNMQVNNAGQPVYMEAVSWFDHPEFLQYFLSTQKNRIGIIERRNIELNSGLFAEIFHISDSLDEQVQKARVCYKLLNEKYVIGEGRGEYPAESLFVNVLNPKDQQLFITLKEFHSLVSLELLQKLDQYSQFFWNGDERSGGAQSCIEELLGKGLSQTDYRQIPQCVRSANFLVRQNSVVDHYCLPELFQPIPLRNQVGL